MEPGYLLGLETWKPGNIGNPQLLSVNLVMFVHQKEENLTPRHRGWLPGTKYQPWDHRTVVLQTIQEQHKEDYHTRYSGDHRICNSWRNQNLQVWYFPRDPEVDFLLLNLDEQLLVHEDIILQRLFAERIYRLIVILIFFSSQYIQIVLLSLHTP